MKQLSLKILIGILGLCLCVSSCKDEDIAPAKVSFEIPVEGYNAYMGDEIIIKPTVESKSGVTHEWIELEKVISREATLKYKSLKPGVHIIKYIATNDDGKTEETINITIKKVDKPVIEIKVPSTGFEIAKEKTLKIEAKITSIKECKYEWKEGDKVISNELILNYKSKEVKEHKLKLKVTNVGGSAEKEISINVVTTEKPTATFGDKKIFYGERNKSLVIKPTVKTEGETTYKWLIDGVIYSKVKDLTYIPNKNGCTLLTYEVTNNAGSNSYNLNLIVGYRAITESSSLQVNKVYEFRPAPGQFVNESYKCNTMEEANEFALKALHDKNMYLSLGGFGGYVVMGFDHSIIDREGKDVLIKGNSFTGPSGCSCEPGIVEVMQDTNGNGLPDDEWYELKGENYDDATTIKGYEITYFRPESPSQNVKWKDNQGNEGCIDYLGMFHSQPYYYPLWIAEDSYTLKGTRLKARTVQDPSTGFWSNMMFEKGYVDNYEIQADEDINDINNESSYGGNTFEISNAIDKHGNPVKLGFIDFVKVYTGVNVKAGWLGENSTEIFVIEDLPIKK